MKEQEEIGPFPLLPIIICVAIIIVFLPMIDLAPRPKGGSYPLEILQPIHLATLPHLIDDDTKEIVFIKNGCLKASREEVKALRDKSSADKDSYLINGQSIEMKAKLCGKWND